MRSLAGSGSFRERSQPWVSPPRPDAGLHPRAATGSVNRNVVPWPRRLSTAICPPSDSTSRPAAGPLPPRSCAAYSDRTAQAAGGHSRTALIELKEADICCGSAGVYNVVHNEMSDRLLESKMRRIRETAGGTGFDRQSRLPVAVSRRGEAPGQPPARDARHRIAGRSL